MKRRSLLAAALALLASPWLAKASPMPSGSTSNAKVTSSRGYVVGLALAYLALGGLATPDRSYASNGTVNTTSGYVGPTTLGNDSFTKALLHFDGSNGSTTITDSNSGGSGHAWTAGGNAALTTGTVKFGTAAITFDGSGDYVTTPDSADFTVGSGDFTVDCWFNYGGSAGTRSILFGQANSSATTSSISVWMEHTTANKIQGFVGQGASAVTITGTTSITTSGWHHAALVRTGNVLKLFLDGTQEGGDAAITGTINDSSNALRVGMGGEFTTTPWNGQVDEFRLSVGTARWTSNFTPSAAAYSTSSDNMTLVTTTQTADTTVGSVRVLMEIDPIDSITLNTDLTVEVTCDSGSHFASATLSSVGYGQSGRTVVETTDQSCGANTGTGFAARVKTLNNKSVNIYKLTASAH